jgi:hypothetical protein
VGVLEWILAHLPSSLVNAAKGYLGRPRPELRVRQLAPVGGGTDVEFRLVVQNVGTKAAWAEVTAHVGETPVRLSTSRVELLPQAPSTTIEIRVPRPALGDLVKEFNSDTTLYGETLTVELAEGKHHASETWREHVYTREENADRFDVQQRIWAQARAGKQSGAAPGDRAPRTRDEEAQLLLARPPAWEYLYFAAVLLRERDSLDTSWRNHEVAYTRPSGPNLDLRGAQRIRQFREFVDRAVTALDEIPPKLRAGEDVTLTLDLTVSVDEEVSEAFYRELARLTERAQRGELDFDG